ncbi:hypothetical protein UFOVP1244_57 [uncultured Caudovirales phage]|uniref:Uncharacterized protein n=1 Tax=uncultured Caudovirales phage TaxID=2100421 RepID=A0A6J5R5N4_9CAUD|nr:hypothetical protein UFOVP1244_57 [uncultured Caudovirales phage]
MDENKEEPKKKPKIVLRPEGFKAFGEPMGGAQRPPDKKDK